MYKTSHLWFFLVRFLYQNLLSIHTRFIYQSRVLVVYFDIKKKNKYYFLYISTESIQTTFIVFKFWVCIRQGRHQWVFSAIVLKTSETLWKQQSKIFQKKSEGQNLYFFFERFLTVVFKGFLAFWEPLHWTLIDAFLVL